MSKFLSVVTFIGFITVPGFAQTSDCGALTKTSQILGGIVKSLTENQQNEHAGLHHPTELEQQAAEYYSAQITVQKLIDSNHCLYIPETSRGTSGEDVRGEAVITDATGRGSNGSVGGKDADDRRSTYRPNLRD